MFLLLENLLPHWFSWQKRWYLVLTGGQGGDCGPQQEDVEAGAGCHVQNQQHSRRSWWGSKVQLPTPTDELSYELRLSSFLVFLVLSFWCSSPKARARVGVMSRQKTPASTSTLLKQEAEFQLRHQDQEVFFLKAFLALTYEKKRKFGVVCCLFFFKSTLSASWFRKWICRYS